MRKRILVFILALALVFSTVPVSAQTATPPPGPIYIVQEGDNLWDIAARFNVTVNDIVIANNMFSQDIFPGNQLIIPGLGGLSGTLVTTPVPFGETLRSLSRQYSVDPALLIKLNHIVSPAELYAGYNLILLQQDEHPALTARTALANGDTLLELAVRQNTDPWTITQLNGLTGPYAGLPGDVLYLPSGYSTAALTGLPAAFVSAEVDPLPITQGATVQVKVTASQTVTLGGWLGASSLHFFPLDEPNSQVALQGINGDANPGLYPLRLDVTLLDGSSQSFEQMVLVKSGNFINETINGVEPNTIDPAVTEPELEWLQALVAPVTPEKYWQGMFHLPVDSQYYIRSYYGTRRSYNNGALYAFHTGLDFGVFSATKPFDVYAPADGVVVAIQSDAGHKTVRGNATIIDHGQGVYSGLYHQAEINVAVGDHVAADQLIGKIGDTGRANGAHLHWDLWVNGVQVDPIEWLDESFPH